SPSRNLDPHARSGRIPGPVRPLDGGSDQGRRCPRPAIIVAVSDENVFVIPAKGEPDPPGVPIDDGAGIADGDFRRVAFFVNDSERSPQSAGVGASLQHQIDVAVVATSRLSPLAKGEQRAFGSRKQGGNPISVIAFAAADEDVYLHKPRRLDQFG